MPSALTAFPGGLFGLRCGSGEARVLLLHGWGRSATELVAIAEPPGLEPVAAISLDLPGFGSSPAPPEAWGAAAYAEALVPMLEQLAGPVVVLGHSFGGRVAVCLAASHPELVAGLVLSGVPLLPREDRGRRRPPLGYRLLRWAARRGLVGEARLEAARRRHGSADYAAASGVMRDVLVRVVGERYDDQLGQLRCPVAMVWGGADADVPVEVAQRALALLDAGELEVVPGGTHDLVRERPELLRRAIDELLARTAS